MIYGELEISRFPDGEADLWPLVKNRLPDGGAINSPAKELCELRRADMVGALGHHAIRRGVSFAITPRESVYFTDEKLLDQWGYGQTADGSGYGIQIPRYAVTRRPQPGEGVDFRHDIPAHLVVSWMAHELSRHDRRVENPDRYRLVYEASGSPEAIRDEELLTAAGAYQLLHRKAIYLTPEDYTTSVPENPADPAYHEDLINLLTEVDSSS